MKKQNIIFILIVLLVVILIIGGVLLFRKDSVELEMIVTKGNSIYTINNLGEEIEIMDMSNYNDFVYTYKNNKLYLYLYTNKTIDGEVVENNFIGYIDLLDEDYELNSLSRATLEGTPESIAVTNDYIYFTLVHIISIFPDAKTPKIEKLLNLLHPEKDIINMIFDQYNPKNKLFTHKNILERIFTYDIITIYGDENE